MRIAIIGLAAALALPAAVTAQDPVAVAEGARVWATNCTRCHNARPSGERSDGQWKTIVLHMRARANLTRADADLVATFLAATNAAPSATAVAPEPEAADAPEGETAASDDAGRTRPELRMLVRYLALLSVR